MSHNVDNVVANWKHMCCDKATSELHSCTKNGTQCCDFATGVIFYAKLGSSTPARRVILEVCNFTLIKGGFVKLHECIFCTHSTWIMGRAYSAWCMEKPPDFSGGFPISFWDDFVFLCDISHCFFITRLVCEPYDYARCHWEHGKEPEPIHARPQTLSHVCMITSAWASFTHGIRNKWLSELSPVGLETQIIKILSTRSIATGIPFIRIFGLISVFIMSPILLVILCVQFCGYMVNGWVGGLGGLSPPR